jgi:DNA-binding FadR family transcriptional regulator|tara:strand:+ start:447 stop:1163 length:717 start_codon:yes stop_codon:yes gene_type:complete
MTDLASLTDEETPWTPVRATSIAGKIVQQVREALFDGQLQPGHALGSEMELAEQFGVSRITIRDALRSLETMGVIEIRVGAGGGATIASGNIEYFSDALAIQFKLSGVTTDEVVDAQVAVECAAVELAAKNRTAEDLARLAELIAESEEVLDDPVKFTHAGQQFHLAVAEASGNRALVAQFMALRHVVWPNNAHRATRPVAEKAVDYHRNILTAIKRQDRSSARNLMREHLDEIRERL